MKPEYQKHITNYCVSCAGQDYDNKLQCWTCHGIAVNQWACVRCYHAYLKKQRKIMVSYNGQ